MYYALLIALFFGKLFPIIDIFIILFAITNIFSQKNYAIKNKNLLFFTIFAIISNLLYFNILGWLYLVRLLSLSSLLIFPPLINQYQQKFLNIILFSIVIFDFIQYLYWPNLTIMASQNWDPHLYRLVGSYFDPTFTGLILLFILLYIYFSKTKYKLLLMSFVYTALALTYSRSTLFSFFIVFTYISIIKKKSNIFFYTLIIIVTTLLILPRMPGEGTKLERTSSIFAKVENYKQGVNIFLQHPLVGIGYNNIPLLNYKNNLLSHSNSGFDSSLLTIAITSGVVGLILLLAALYFEFINANIFYQSLLLAVFIHSFFANSLFYPYSTVLLIILNAKSQKLH